MESLILVVGTFIGMLVLSTAPTLAANAPATQLTEGRNAAMGTAIRNGAAAIMQQIGQNDRSHR